MINNNQPKNIKTEYLLTYLSIAMLNPTFAQYNIISIVFTLISFYYFKKNKLKFDKLFAGIIIVLNGIAISQAFVFSSFSYSSYFGIFLIFLMPYFMIRILRERYWYYYTNLIYILAVIALVFWSLQNIVGEPVTNLLVSISKGFNLDPISNESIIIYNLEHQRPTDILGIIKNAGFTAEGGLYSCLLILALFINTIDTKQIFNKKNSVFMISLLSTNSTAGYIALGIYLVGSSLYLKRISYKILLFPASLTIFVLSIIKLPFLLEKVSDYYYTEMRVYSTQVAASRVGRFLSARIDMDIIAENPLWGRGIYRENRFLTILEEKIGYSNSYLGVIGLASRYGLVLWLIYFSLLMNTLFKFIKMNYLKRNYAFIFLFSIIAVAFGQNPFTHPPYLVLTYLGFYLNENIHYNTQL